MIAQKQLNENEQTTKENERECTIAVTIDKRSISVPAHLSNYAELMKRLEEKIEPSSHFNPHLLMQAFVQSFSKSSESVEDHDDIKIREYLIAYHELNKFLESLGTLFYFVITDVRDKINLLEKYLESDEQNYSTVLKTVEYEKSISAFSKHSPMWRTNGSRTFLRLHRALIFISKFIERLFNADEKLKTPHLAAETYEATLAKHHSWIIRKAVLIGMHALPKREVLIGHMCQNEQDLEHSPFFIYNLEKVYNITQNIYEERELLDLA